MAAMAMLNNPMIMMFSEKSAIFALLCAIEVFGYRADGWHWFLGLYVPQLIWTWRMRRHFILPHFVTLCRWSILESGWKCWRCTLKHRLVINNIQAAFGVTLSITSWMDCPHDNMATAWPFSRFSRDRVLEGKELWNKNCMWWVLVGAVVSLALEPYLSDPFSISASIIQPGDGDRWRPHEVCDWPGGRAGAHLVKELSFFPFLRREKNLAVITQQPMNMEALVLSDLCTHSPPVKRCWYGSTNIRWMPWSEYSGVHIVTFWWWKLRMWCVGANFNTGSSQKEIEAKESVAGAVRALRKFSILTYSIFNSRSKPACTGQTFKARSLTLV